MADAFVYYFLIHDRSSGRLVSSKRRATLKAIKSRGEPLLESEMTVDDSEIDAAGFLVGRTIGGSDPTEELWGEIRSLRLRAESREREAKQLNDGPDQGRRLILCAESRELRRRADRLQQIIRRPRTGTPSDGTPSDGTPSDGTPSDETSGERVTLALQTFAPHDEAAKCHFFKPE
jgi:hypothetical protein